MRCVTSMGKVQYSRVSNLTAYSELWSLLAPDISGSGQFSELRSIFRAPVNFRALSSKLWHFRLSVNPNLFRARVLSHPELNSSSGALLTFHILTHTLLTDFLSIFHTLVTEYVCVCVSKKPLSLPLTHLCVRLFYLLVFMF